MRINVRELPQNMTMILQGLFLCSYFTMTLTSGITCYRCAIVPKAKSQDKLCSQFDGSTDYQVHCPNSTLCLKKTTVVPIKNGEVITVQMGCASQKADRHVWNYETRKWNKNIEIVESAYQEGCSQGPDTGRPGMPSEYCYCKTDLCNESHPNIRIDLTLVILHMAGFILVACRYFTI